MAMDESKLRKFLKANPEYRKVLRNAVIYEDSHSDEKYLTGWIFGVGARDSQARELVYQGIVRMSFDSGNKVDFRLVDREMTRKVLRMKAPGDTGRRVKKQPGAQ